MSATAEVPTGNTFDKYGSSNPLVKRLMAGFHSTLDELFAQAAPRSILDVGCGEGVLTHQWAERLGDGRIVGIDLDDPKLRAEWEKRQRANLEYRAEEATSLSFADDEFDMATAIEVLEHVPEPESTLSEMARVARRRLLVSVPREPLWRGRSRRRWCARAPSSAARAHSGTVQRRAGARRAGRARGCAAGARASRPGCRRPRPAPRTARRR